MGVLPRPPSGLSATAANDAGDPIQLSWVNTSQIATGYRIEQSSDGSDYALVETVGPAASSYTVSGLVASTEYYFRVCAVDDAGQSTYAVANRQVHSEYQTDLSLRFPSVRQRASGLNCRRGGFREEC